ncbi:lymphocyte antigen 75-like [Chelmon rostratus]|uniref:lymphocyte antigen 75-like n=1 Tax=Chelmon rostratus TaxID=109905 RepID=UPI001BEB4CA0|nr:lymphocyte antigen 75-like [Chelmon rostratus]
MTGTAVILVLSGLCFLPPCFPRLYILVENPKNWSEAQNYCKWKYTDLASVHNEQDLAQLNELLEGKLNTWIGLQADAEAWKWSLQKPGFYGEGEAGFRMWNADEPNGGPAYYKLCAAMYYSSGWVDAICSWSLKFICYNGTGGTNDTSSSFIFVAELKTWEEAQSYCREHYTDLASVRNQAENDQIRKMTKDNAYTWIGLYRDSWKWSDGSTHSFANWATNAPSVTYSHSCAVSNFGKWQNADCNMPRNFVCYSVPTVRRQVVRVALKKTDASVDMEELKDDILQKLNQRLKDHNVGEDMKLRWVEQPDGKVFHKKDTDKKKTNY